VEGAITYHREALTALYPPGQPDRSMSLNNLGVAVSTRYEQLDRIEDIGDAIEKRIGPRQLNANGGT